MAAIKKYDSSIFLDTVFTHLQRAEYFFRQGKETSDDQFYTDVIYRCNQAFEGGLKEAYKILAQKDEHSVSQETPNNIEKYFASNKLFKDRVLKQFENYRKEWRNKSTHDHKLFFDQSEAFLALVSVSAFIYLLFNQILEQLGFANSVAQSNNLPRNSESLANLAITEAIELIIDSFLQQFEKSSVDTSMKEQVFSGMLHGFLAQTFPQIKIRREPLIVSNNYLLRPDFVFEINNSPCILEVKRRIDIGVRDADIHQVITYMNATGARHAVLFYYARSDRKMLKQTATHTINAKTYHIVVYAPAPAANLFTSLAHKDSSPTIDN